MAWHTAALMRVKGKMPTIDEMVGAKPEAKPRGPSAAKAVFAAMREGGG